MDIGEAQQQAAQALAALREVLGMLTEVCRMPDLAVKRQQIKSVGKSIHELERRGIPVPDELRRVKTSLGAAVYSVDEADKALAAIRGEVESLLLELGGSRRGVVAKRGPRHSQVRQAATDAGGAVVPVSPVSGPDTVTTPKVLDDVLAVIAEYRKSLNWVRALQDRATDTGVTPGTIRDACTRRLGLNASHFRALLDQPDKLKESLCRKFPGCEDVIGQVF